jgi:hypothetical protein
MAVRLTSWISAGLFPGRGGQGRHASRPRSLRRSGPLGGRPVRWIAVLVLGAPLVAGAGTLATTLSATASPTITSPAAGGSLNDNQSIEPSPVSCGFDPTDNGPFNFATGLAGTAEPATSMSLPAGASDYFYVGSDAGGNPLTSISWNPDLSVTAAYSGNEAVSIGQSTSDSASFGSGSTTNVAIAGLGVTGYQVTGAPVTASTSTGTSVSLNVTTGAGDLLLVVVGGEGVGLLQQGGASLSTLLNVTYSECGSDVIASAGMFAAFLPAGTNSVSISGTTYSTNSGTSMGAVAYVLAPAAAPPPTDVTAIASGNEAQICWSPPQGASSIASYLVASSSNALGTTTVPAAQNCALWSGLINGTTYTFTVQTVLADGSTSPPSAPSNSVEAGATPSLTTIDVTSGPYYGTTLVDLFGTNFPIDPVVYFGTAQATLIANSSDQITVISPPCPGFSSSLYESLGTHFTSFSCTINGTAESSGADTVPIEIQGEDGQQATLPSAFSYDSTLNDGMQSISDITDNWANLSGLVPCQVGQVAGASLGSAVFAGSPAWFAVPGNIPDASYPPGVVPPTGAIVPEVVTVSYPNDPSLGSQTVTALIDVQTGSGCLDTTNGVNITADGPAPVFTLEPGRVTSVGEYDAMYSAQLSTAPDQTWVVQLINTSTDFADAVKDYLDLWGEIAEHENVDTSIETLESTPVSVESDLSAIDGEVANEASIIQSGGGLTSVSETVGSGETVDISGGGYQAEGTVDVQVASVPFLLGQFSVNSSGEFSTSVTMPFWLSPGTHTLFATGDSSGGLLRLVEGQITVTAQQGCIVSKFRGPLTVSNGQKVCITAGGSIDGPVRVRRGGELSIDGGTISGPVRSTGASAITVCNATIRGPLTITGTTGAVFVGDPAPGCLGNLITGPMTVSRNTGGVVVEGNDVIGPVKLLHNSKSPATVGGNRILGLLACIGNSPPPTDGGSTNMVAGPSFGQCEGLSTFGAMPPLLPGAVSQFQFLIYVAPG